MAQEQADEVVSNRHRFVVPPSDKNLPLWAAIGSPFWQSEFRTPDEHGPLLPVSGFTLEADMTDGKCEVTLTLTLEQLGDLMVDLPDTTQHGRITLAGVLLSHEEFADYFTFRETRRAARPPTQ